MFLNNAFGGLATRSGSTRTVCAERSNSVAAQLFYKRDSAGKSGFGIGVSLPVLLFGFVGDSMQVSGGQSWELK